jgi:hypothetical protein
VSLDHVNAARGLAATSEVKANTIQLDKVANKIQACVERRRSESESNSEGS